MNIAIVAMLSGFISHFSGDWIHSRVGVGYAEMLGYTEGVFVSYIFFEKFLEMFRIPKGIRQICGLCFFAAFFFVGIGVLLGWLARPTKLAVD